MKKQLLGLVAAGLLLAGCETTGTASATSTTGAGGLKACAMENAVNAVADGSVFTNGVRPTASSISSKCLKQLAMTKMGLEQPTADMVENMLNVLIKKQ